MDKIEDMTLKELERLLGEARKCGAVDETKVWIWKIDKRSRYCQNVRNVTFRDKMPDKPIIIEWKA